MTWVFDVLQTFFKWADSNTRKRLADRNIEAPSPVKRPRCGYETMQNGGDIIDLCGDDDDDIQIFKEVKHAPKSRHSFNHVNRRLSRPLNSNGIDSHIRSAHPTGTTMSKNMLGIRASRGRRCSTLNRSYRLREKEEYGQMLQNFLPSRVSVAPKKSESRKGPAKPIEVIDVENYKPSTSSATPEAFSTPKFSNITRWYTPMTRPGASWREKTPIQEVKLDDSDEITAEDSDCRIEELPRHDGPIPTNSLRDKLSAKAVMKADFIPRVAETYNSRMQQHSKDLEEMEKVSQALAKRNRIHREVALEKQLAQSLRLCEAVLEEADYADEAELPELTPPMLEEVKKALNPRPPDEILVEAFGLRIMRKDIHTLAGLNWLNDEVINFYMNLLIDRGGKGNFPKVYAMNTFFYPKLISNGHSSLKRWTRKVDIFSKDIIVVPIHLGMHWCMSIIDFRDKSIRYYDSMGGENPKCLSALRKYLIDECADKKKEIYDTSDWILESMMDIPQQMNGSDCGVFSCTFAEFICGNRNLNFSQDDMPYFRSKMVYEILHVQLL